jgi:hypothetical protein
VGQTGRTFNTRYREHIYDVKVTTATRDIQDIDTGHICDTMEDTTDVVRIGRKRQYLNTLEKYYIRKISKGKLHMNDTNIDEHHSIFDELQKIYEAPTSHTPHPSPPTQL